MGVTAAITKYLRVGDPLWAVRRRCAVAGLIFCAGMVIDAAHFVADQARALALINAASTSSALIFSAYLFAATWADKQNETEK